MGRRRVFLGLRAPELSHKLPLPRSDPAEIPSCPLQTPELGLHGIGGRSGQTAIEDRAHGGCVSAHGGEDKPVAHIQLWQLHVLLEELVKGIAGGTVQSAGEEGRLRGKLLQGAKGKGSEKE